MAEPTAQNKLGELFVDLGVSGLGTTLKALNSVSASFLMTKNAAQQAISPIINMSKEGGNLAVAIKKVNAVTGLSEVKLRALEIFAKQNDSTFEQLEGTLENLQQKIFNAKFRMNDNDVQAFNILGIDPNELSELDPIAAFDKIQNALSKLQPVARTSVLSLLNIPKEMSYIFEKTNGSLDKTLELLIKKYNINEKQINNLYKQKQAWNDIEATTRKIKDNIVGGDGLTNALLQLSKDVHRLEYITNPENKEEIKNKLKDPKKRQQISNKITNKFIQSWEDDPMSALFPINALLKPIQDRYFGKNVASSVGATVIEGADEPTPPLPNVQPSSVSNTTSNSNVIYNYNNYWDNNFSIMGNGSAEQAYEIQEHLLNQQKINQSGMINTAGN